MKTQMSVLAGALALCFGMVASPSAVALVMVTAEFSGTPTPNDCAGTFGVGVICDVGFALSPSTAVSPIIAKKDVNDNGGVTATYTNPNFTTVTGNEFVINYGTDTKSGTWTYTPEAGDPAVRYWAAKDGDGFILHWMINDTDTGSCGTAYTLACLQKAQVVTTGSWSTLGKELSHLSWYDTDGGTPPLQIPEPGALFLMGAGLLGLGMARRRKST